jgi:tetratricopeptide (TPR) repeat protein
MTGATIRRTVAISILAVGLACVARPAFAQSGQIKGKVTDAQGNPVDAATIELLNTDKGAKPITVKTNKKGEYIQVGLYPGHYKVTASKDALKVTDEVDVHLDMLNHDIKLVSGGGAAATGSKEDVAKAKARADALTKSFADGVALSKEGKADEAIAKFQEVAATLPNCAECYINIGTVQTNAKKYDEAEASFKKALEMKPDSADAYDGLANLYNAEKKFPEAEAAGKKAVELSAAAAGGAGGAAAGGTASAAALYNQAVILWNQNKAQEAADKLDAAIKADPNFPEAHYLMGKANINLGKLPESAKELQEYLRLAPNGPNKDDANKTLEMLKPYIK